jgi:hypothetical protein
VTIFGLVCVDRSLWLGIRHGFVLAVQVRKERDQYSGIDY